MYDIGSKIHEKEVSTMSFWSFWGTNPEDRANADLRQENARKRRERACKRIQLDLLRANERLDRELDSLDKQIERYYSESQPDTGDDKGKGKHGDDD